MTTINAFNDIDRVPIESSTTVAGQDDLTRTSSIKIGSGATAFKADSSGIWLGANKFADAVFSVDMNGNLVANTGNITGVVRIGIDGGDASIVIDGVNKRIIINDGTDDRVLLGYQSGGF